MHEGKKAQLLSCHFPVGVPRSRCLFFRVAPSEPDRIPGKSFDVSISVITAILSQVFKYHLCTEHILHHTYIGEHYQLGMA